MEPETLSPTPYALFDLVEPEATTQGHVQPAPPGFRSARVRFEAACSAYRRARYREAAAGFLDAARAMPRGPASHADTLMADRTAAYRNAAHALALVEGPEAARRTLAPLASHDPACAVALRDLGPSPR